MARFHLLIFGFCLIVGLHDAFAKTAKEITPLTQLDDATKAMLKGLNENQTRQFAAVRDLHGVINGTTDVRRDLDAAANSCSTANPALRTKMDKAFAEWTHHVDPSLRDGRDRLTTMLRMQSFASLKEAKEYLKKLDAAVAYKARGIEKIPIRSKKDCLNLANHMIESVPDLEKLLRENLGLGRPLQSKGAR